MMAAMITEPTSSFTAKTLSGSASSAMCLNFLPWTRVTGGSSLAAGCRSAFHPSEKNDLHEL